MLFFHSLFVEFLNIKIPTWKFNSSSIVFSRLLVIFFSYFIWKKFPFTLFSFPFFSYCLLLFTTGIELKSKTTVIIIFRHIIHHHSHQVLICHIWKLKSLFIHILCEIFFPKFKYTTIINQNEAETSKKTWKYCPWWPCDLLWCVCVFDIYWVHVLVLTCFGPFFSSLLI